MNEVTIFDSQLKEKLYPFSIGCATSGACVGTVFIVGTPARQCVVARIAYLLGVHGPKFNPANLIGHAFLAQHFTTAATRSLFRKKREA